MNLHIFSQSPFTSNVSRSSFEAIKTGDTILFISDACYFLQGTEALLNNLKPLDSQQVNIFALEQDCRLRGLSEKLDQQDHIKACTIDNFVELSLNAKHILNG